MPSGAPELSVIVLTRNEEANIEDAVRSLVAGPSGVEVIVVDSASRDGTMAVARRLEAELGPERLRLIASPTDIAIGRARNLGVAAARAPRIAFMSADATAAPGWAEEAISALEGADLAFGRQEHAPPDWSVAAVLRGLRYHHFADDARRPPETYASNVNAAIQREVLDRVRYVEDGAASALDDVLFTREAMRLGHRVAYRPRMLVRHKDVSTLRQELRKNRREGYGRGLLARHLGLDRVTLAWGAALAATLAALALWPGWPIAALLAGLVYAPSLRRAFRAGAAIAKRAGPARVAGAVAIAPAFDLAFLVSYLRGLAASRSAIGRAPAQAAPASLEQR